MRTGAAVAAPAVAAPAAAAVVGGGGDWQGEVPAGTHTAGTAASLRSAGCTTRAPASESRVGGRGHGGQVSSVPCAPCGGSALPRPTAGRGHCWGVPGASHRTKPVPKGSRSLPSPPVKELALQCSSRAEARGTWPRAPVLLHLHDGAARSPCVLPQRFWLHPAPCHPQPAPCARTGGTNPPAHTSRMHPHPPCSIQYPCGAGGLQGVCLLLASCPSPQRCQPCRSALMQHPWLQHPHLQPVVGDPRGGKRQETRGGSL